MFSTDNRFEISVSISLLLQNLPLFSIVTKEKDGRYDWKELRLCNKPYKPSMLEFNEPFILFKALCLYMYITEQGFALT